MNILQEMFACYRHCTFSSHLLRLKRNIQCNKGGYETQSGLRAPNLLNSVESYAVYIRVKVAEPVQISYTGKA